MKINSIIFIIFACLWTCHEAASPTRDTLKAGDTLNSSSSLVSASGKFILAFIVRNVWGTDSSYLAILDNKKPSNTVWIANQRAPILHPSSALLTLDRNNTLKITYQGGDPIILFTTSNSTSSGVVATLMDSGNFLLQEVDSVDGSMTRFLWQSFDYPTNTFLPGMKLGIDRRNGHKYNWYILAWATDYYPARGRFSLSWDPNARELKIKRSGVIYWTSGVFRSDGRFEFILPDESRYNFSIISNENEDYLTYSAVDDQSGLEPEWVLYSNGTLHDYGGHVDTAIAGNCDGYNTGGGCVRRDRPADCTMAKFGDEFQLKHGYFKPIMNLGSRPPYWFHSNMNESGTSSDCEATCWQNCSCIGFEFPVSDNRTTNGTGCRFWSEDSQFVEDLIGSVTSTSSYVFPRYSITPTKPPPRKNTDHGNKWRWIGTTIAAVLVMVFCIWCYLLRTKKFKALAGEHVAKIKNQLINFMKSDIGRNQNDHTNMGHHDLFGFGYDTILAATCNFSEENKLGEGGFGPVYKGKLVTEQEIAVKRLSRCSAQGTLEFKNEYLILISELQHTNLVQLFGFCIHEEERMLIYEYMPNKSLDHFLFDSNRRAILDWKKRFSIIEGITQGMLYLHKFSRKRVIHRDLKASNILLDETMNPKISDFGIARIFTESELEANTKRIVGTRGYMPPEYVIGGKFSIKSDVYSFGVLLLEIISGRKNNSFNDEEHVLSLVEYAWELWKEGAGLRLMDSTLGDSCSKDQVRRCIHVGLLCVEENAVKRPTMSDVLSILTNESIKLPEPTKPAFCTERNVSAAGIGIREQQTFSANDLSISDFGGR